jgi:hypothetical protein
VARKTEVEYFNLLTICTPPSASTFSPPATAYEEVPYSYSFTVQGDGPFTAGIALVPWLTTSVVGNVVTISGTPPVGAASILSIQMGVGGKCGAISLSFNINIQPLSACVPVTFKHNPFDGLPNAVVGIPYNYLIKLEGSGPYVVQLVNHNIPWMTFTPVSSGILCTGTPTVAASNQTTDLNITNCNQVILLNVLAQIDVLASCAILSIPAYTPMPNATELVPYSYTFTVNGSSVIDYQVLQAFPWLDVYVHPYNNTATIFGTPPLGSSGTSEFINIKFTNCGVPLTTSNILFSDILTIN